MENNNEAKGIKKVLLMFWQYIKNICYDFITSFKYNNMKLPGLLIAVPGVFIGFFLMFHAPVVKQMSFIYSELDLETFTIVEGNYIGFDYTGIVLFVLMLFGILNIFTAASVMGKKNLGSVILALLSTVVIVICGALYIFAIFFYRSLVIDGKIIIDGGWAWNINYIMAIFSVALSMIASIVGIVLAFIYYDRTYEKVNR